MDLSFTLFGEPYSVRWTLLRVRGLCFIPEGDKSPKCEVLGACVAGMLLLCAERASKAAGGATAIAQGAEGGSTPGG